MATRLATIDGPVGYVELEADGTIKLRLEIKWIQVLEELNQAIRQKKSFLGRFGKLVTVHDQPQPEQLEILRDLLRARSQGSLFLKTTEELEKECEGIPRLGFITRE